MLIDIEHWLSKGISQNAESANILRCSWCFTLLMKLHDSVTEPFNPEHIFRDARTVYFCLPTDHISTCLMMFSARLKTAQCLVCSGYVVNGSVASVLVSDVDISGPETCQYPWSTMESVVWRPVSFHGVAWRAQCGNRTFSWSTMRCRSCVESSHQRSFVGHIRGFVENLYSANETNG